MDVWRINTESEEIEIITLKLKSYGEVESNGKFQFGPLLWVLNLIGNNAFRRGVHLNPLLNPPNGTIVKIVSFSLSQRTNIDIQWEKHLFSDYINLFIFCM